MKQRFLFTLLMAIVMMAMSPMKSWADYDHAEYVTNSMSRWISFHDEVVIYAEAGEQLTISLYDGIGEGGEVYPEEDISVTMSGVSDIPLRTDNSWWNSITFGESGFYKIILSDQNTSFYENWVDDPEGGGWNEYHFASGSAKLSIVPVEVPFLSDGVNADLTFAAQSQDVSNAPSDYTLYRYTVTRDGILEVAASGEGDSYGILLDDKLNALIQDDNSNGNNDFKLALRVKSGETYVIGARAKALGTELTNYTLTITERNPIVNSAVHVTDNSSLAAAVALFDVDQHTIILDNDISDCNCLDNISGLGEYTIDLNGHTLQLRNGDIQIEQFATLHILNGTVAYNDGSRIYNSGELTLSGCFIQNTYTGWKSTIYNTQGATLHFAGACSISADCDYPVFNLGIITFADGYVMKKDGVQISGFDGSIGSSSNCTLLVVPTNLSTLTIADGTSYNSLMAGAEVATLTYTRNVSESQVGKWQALYVPFQMSYSDWSEDFDVATIQNFHEYSDENGVVQDVTLEVRYVKSGMLKANHPYLIRPKTAGEKQIVLSDAVLAEAQNTSIVCQSVERRYTFTGTYQPMQGLYSNNYLFLAGGSLNMAASDETELKAQRWYLAIENLDSQVENAPTPAPAKGINISVIGDDATGIEDIKVISTQFSGANAAAIYDLQGRRQQSMNRGVNIVRLEDGSVKKIMVK